MLPVAEAQKRIALLRKWIGRLPNARLESESPREAYLQTLLSRGDRRVAFLIEALARDERGCGLYGEKRCRMRRRCAGAEARGADANLAGLGARMRGSVERVHCGESLGRGEAGEEQRGRERAQTARRRRRLPESRYATDAHESTLSLSSLRQHTLFRRDVDADC
jgi:hypothetical protein